MAGIGFELQRVLRKGGIVSFLKVALAGTIITAGPWLMSVVGILLIGRTSGSALGEGQRLFLGVISYSFAFGLFVFGGSHYIFTRFVADLVYEEKNREAGSALLLFVLATIVVAGVMAVVAVRFIQPQGISHVGVFRVSIALLFVVINVNWLLMIFVSLLKQFIRIFIVYLLGVVLSFLGVNLLAAPLGLAGALLGFAGGQGFIVIVLYALTVKEFAPGSLPIRAALRYFGTFRYLFLCGTLYYWGIWIDKMVYWFTCGSSVQGTFIRIFDFYDIPVFFANLALIPGLVYFMIINETEFYIRLKVLLKGLQSGTYVKIQEQKYLLVRSIRQGMREQTVLQGVFTAILVLAAAEISRVVFAGGVNVLVLRLTFVAVFFHLSYLTLLIFLFYYQLYRTSALVAAVFLVLNAVGSLIVQHVGNLEYASMGYLVAGVVAGAVGLRAVLAATRSIDRTLYARYSG